jgi:hypothetical protein
MGFYQPEPFDTASASFIQRPNGFGVFLVEVQGNAPNYTAGLTLVRDAHWVGGLKIDVMGWTGPLSQGTAPYTVKGSFPGQYVPQIVIAGANGERLVPVKAISAEDSDSFVQRLAG